MLEGVEYVRCVCRPRDDSTPALPNSHLILPADLTASELTFVIRKKLVLAPSHGLFLFCNGSIFSGTKTAKEMKTACMASGNFESDAIQVTYCFENTFG